MLTLVTPPSVEPVTLADAKMQCRLPSAYTDEDTLLGYFIAAARERCETETDRACVTQTWDYSFGHFPVLSADGSPWNRLAYDPGTVRKPFDQRVFIPKARLQSVTSVSYITLDGTTTTLVQNTDYVVKAGDGGYLVPAIGKYWPWTHYQRPDAVTVRFVAGYGDTAAAVSGAFKAAVLLTVASLYENREAVVAGPGITTIELPLGVQWLLASEKWGCRP